MENEQLCKDILAYAGGKENIKEVFHCITRLRLIVNDLDKVDVDALSGLNGILTVKVVGQQVQCVIGPGVDEVYRDFCEVNGFEEKPLVGEDDSNTPAEDDGDVLAQTQANKDEKTTNPIMKLLNTLSAIITPSLYAIIAGGMLKGLSSTLTALSLADSSGSFITVLNIVADAPFYFMPFLIGYAAAKRFKVNEAYGLMMAGVLMYPTILNNAGESIKLFGLTLPYYNYKGSIFPVLLSVWIFSIIFHFIDKRMPKKIRVVFSGMLSFLIAAPIALIALAPLGNYIAVVMTSAVSKLYEISGPLAGAIFCGIIPLTIIFGIKGWSVIELQNLETLGYDFMLPNFFFSNLAVSGATIAASRKIKNANDKANATSTGLLAILGITEPALYGIGIRYKTPLWACMIGGAAGGCTAAILGVKTYAFAMPGITSIATYFDDGNNIIMVLIAMLVSWIVSFIVSYIMTKPDAEPAK